MNTPVWLLDLSGQAELPEGTFDLDGVIVRPADRFVLGIGVKTGLFTKRTYWTSVEQLLRADGDRAWIAVSTNALSSRPPDGVWLRPDLMVRHGTEPLGSVGWVGIQDQVVTELGVIPADPRVQPRSIRADAIVGLNDRSIDVRIGPLEDEPLLKTDRELEDDVRSRLWGTTDSLPEDVLEQLSVSVAGGVVILGGMVPRKEHRALAETIAREPLEVRGVINRVESGEALAEAGRRTADG